MGISRDHWHKRRKTGGKRPQPHKKRKFELGRPAALTKLGAKRIHTVRTRGGNKKYRALRLDIGNFSWASEGVAKKTRIIDVMYHPSNNELVRTKTLTKSTIVQIDAVPFRQWYESYYALPLGRKKGVKLTEAEDALLNRKRSDKSQKKLVVKQRRAKVEQGLEEQFTAGRVLAPWSIEALVCQSKPPPHTMNKVLLLTVLSTFVLLAAATTHYKEEFDAKWADRWVQSNFKESEGTRGDFVRSAGKFFGDAEADQGVQTSQDARFYAYTSKFPTKFSNKGKDLVVQYTVKHEQNIDCGGGYIKVLPSTVDQKEFNGDAQYNIMFGPDICGSSTKKVHLIFNYNGKNHLLKKNVPCESDQFTHLYTMILHPDNTYEIQIDQKEVAKGSLKEDWDMLEPREIKDPKAKKPEDWVDAKEIADPEDKKPEGYDDIVAQIADPDATKPDDWDDELDGEWEAPQIANPEYKGEWKAKQIPNPAYKGEWVHPLIPNPDFKDDDTLYAFEDNGAVGFELWQVKAGTIFDNILVTDSVEEAKAHAEATWVKTARDEKVAKEEQDKKAKEEEEKKAKEAEANKADAEEEDDEEEEKSKDKDEL